MVALLAPPPVQFLLFSSIVGCGFFRFEHRGSKQLDLSCSGGNLVLDLQTGSRNGGGGRW